MRVYSSSVVGHHSRSQRKGFILFLVLGVVTVLTLAAFQYSDLMNSELQAVERIRKTNEAKSLAISGVHYALAYVGDPNMMANVLGNNPFDYPALFQNVPVIESDNPRNRGYFSIVWVDYDGAADTGMGTIRYGMGDESGKLNLNDIFELDKSGTLLYNGLMRLPNMTEDIADAIIDWLDPDDTPRPSGAESEYYLGLDPPYKAKNGRIDTIDELLLIRGITPTLLYGTDRNRNGRIDTNESDGGAGVNVGWINFLTVYSRERNVDSEGNPRININGNDIQQLYSDLTTTVGEDLANFIVGYRLYGAAPASGGDYDMGEMADLSAAVNRSLSGNPRPRSRISSLSSLISASVVVTANDKKSRSKIITSPLADLTNSRDLLGLMFDKLTTQANADLPARVNVNTAPREVMLSLPGMTEAGVDDIISKRPQIAGGAPLDLFYTTPAWLLTDAGITPQAMAAVERLVSARTQVFRIQAIGYFEEGGPIARVEAVIDANQGKPRIVYFRDLTEQGRAIDPRVLAGP